MGEEREKRVLEMVLIMSVLWQEVAREKYTVQAPKLNVENALNVVMLLFLGRFLWP